MIRLPHTAILLIGWLFVSSEALFPREAETSEQLIWETWTIPANVVSTSESSGLASTKKPKAGFVIKGGLDQWDASEFVKSMGVEKIPGSEAVYDIANESLIVKTTKKNITTIGSVLSYAGLENPPAHVVAELCVYECTISPRIPKTDSRFGQAMPTWQAKSPKTFTSLTGSPERRNRATVPSIFAAPHPANKTQKRIPPRNPLSASKTWGSKPA